MSTIHLLLKVADIPHPALLREALTKAGMTPGQNRISDDRDFESDLPVDVGSENELTTVLKAEGWQIISQLRNCDILELRCKR